MPPFRQTHVNLQYAVPDLLAPWADIFLAHMKFLNFHGQHGARLSRNQSIYGHAKDNPTILISILSPLLFYAPDVYLHTLENIWVDGLIHLTCWRQMIEQLQEEWTDFTLLNTIILTANVSFLAIPSVGNGPSQLSNSIAQNASYVSVITSTGSIILALLLSRQNRCKSRQSVEEIVSKIYDISMPLVTGLFFRQSFWVRGHIPFSGLKSSRSCTVSHMPYLCGGERPP
jgi:hypothetical protein